jgi:hypothetical protein
VIIKKVAKRQADRRDALEAAKRVVSEYPVAKFLSQSTLL